MSGHDNLRPAVAIELHPPGRKIRLENAFHVPRALSLSPSEKLVDKRKRKRKKRKKKKKKSRSSEQAVTFARAIVKRSSALVGNFQANRASSRVLEFREKDTDRDDSFMKRREKEN